MPRAKREKAPKDPTTSSDAASEATVPEGAAKPGNASALPPVASDDVLYLVDLSGYVFRAYHAIAPLSSSKGEPTHAVLGTVNMLQRVVNDRRPKMLAIVMDSKGPTFRKELDPRYKANRPPPPADLKQQMNRCRDVVQAYKFAVFQKDGVEADDLIATLVKRAKAEGIRSVIVSSDKDLMQLVGDDDTDVVLWDTMRNRVFGPGEVREKFGVPPSQVRDLLALMGDTSDNVPGVAGVGPKTASDLLLKFGSLDAIYARIADVERAKLRESLATSEAEARLSQKLVTLKDDVAIDFSRQGVTVGEPDAEALRTLFTELEFTRLLDSVKPPPPKARTTHAVFELSVLEGLAARAKELGRFAFDTETTGLDAMRADLVGFSMSVDAGEGFYVPLAHRYLGAPKQLPWEDVKRVLGPLFASATVEKIAHNLKYDSEVLARHDVPVEGPCFDTMVASYLLDPETPNGLKELARREFDVTMITYDEVTKKQRGHQLAFDEVACEDAAKYAAADADLSLALYERYRDRLDREGLGSLMRDVEMPLTKVLETMETTGVLVDTAKLAALSKHAEGELARLEAKAKELAGREFSIRSRDQLETILFDELGLPVVKRTPKGGRSTDAEVLEELADKHALPETIVAYRELDKLKGTYLDLLPKAVNPRTGRIHTRYGQTTAATGRLSSSDPNLQNIPIRTEVGKEIRAAFVAPPGNLILSADYSQIELRVLAHLAKDQALVDAFRSGDDIHARTAALVFEVEPKDVTSEMRRRAKAINFGVIYGMGDSALGKTLGISRDEAAQFIAAYFSRYEGVASFLKRTVESARNGEAVRTLLGRRRFLPNLHSENRGLRMEAERIAKNTPIQGTAADILKLAMVELGRATLPEGTKMILTVHDELVFEVPEKHVAAVTSIVRDAMQGVVKLEVPLVVDVGVGENWAKAH
ncbi:MAG: DNA polymerase I [Polyangiaceae bacterium]